jgi:hypothetical protein
MITVNSTRASRGVVTLFVTVMMLLLITTMAAMAVKLSTTNLVAVGNVQTRAGAIAAAEKVIGAVLSEDPAAVSFHRPRRESVDVNRDGSSDYSVEVSVPVCVRATPASSVAAYSVTLSDYVLEAQWDTLWEISAVVSDEQTGARVSIAHAWQYLMSGNEKAAVCG